jgi:predicted cupin superfamily sugar epimerase
MSRVEQWIKKLNLQPHPEGGYYTEVYRSDSGIELERGHRNLCTSIYFLLNQEDKSHFHILSSDEIWYFHEGSDLRIHMLRDGSYHFEDIGKGEKANLQVLIPAGTIFAAEVLDESSYGLVSCMVNPGFDFEDFRLIDKEELEGQYPGYEDLIEKFTLK